MNFLSIDVGGSEIKYCLINEDLVIADYGFVDTPKSSFDDFSNCILKIYNGFDCKIECICMSVPGFINIKTGVCEGGGPLEYNYQVNIKERISNLLKCDTHVENDAKAAMLAEHESGSLKDCENCAVFIIGSGIGGAIVLNNKLIRGKHSTAGEFSFINVDINNWQNIDSSLEKNCSTRSLLNAYKAKKNLSTEISGREFFENIEKDDDALEVLRRICKNIAIQIYNLGVALDVEKVAIGGGISRQPIVLDMIKKEIEELKLTSPLNTGRELYFPEVVNCKYYNEANLIGAYISYKRYYEKNN